MYIGLNEKCGRRRYYSQCSADKGQRIDSSLVCIEFSIAFTKTYIGIYINLLRIPRVFENRLLRRIFGPKRDEVTGEWRKLHNEELHDLYSSSSIIRTIKSTRMRWAGNVARMGRRGTLIDYWWESQRERDH
jgi:hypothetical protein